MLNDCKQLSTHLVGVAVEVKVLQEAGGELAEQRVVRLVDGSQAPVGVVVGAGARAESTHCTVIEMHCKGAVDSTSTANKCLDNSS